MSQKNKHTICALLIGGLLATSHLARADAVQDANRLLRVTEMGSQFETVALRQTRAIIRSYASIVATSVDVPLPQTIRRNIAACYAQVYAWKNFEAGIAQILADTFSQKELLILIDFFRSRGVPPAEIDTFKGTSDKAADIQRLAAEYIFANSTGCVESDTQMILAYLNQRHLLEPTLPIAAAE